MSEKTVLFSWMPNFIRADLQSENALQNLQYNGEDVVRSWDESAGWASQIDVYSFEASFGDNETVTINVSKEYDFDRAVEIAESYAETFGKLPAVMRTFTDTVNAVPHIPGAFGAGQGGMFHMNQEVVDSYPGAVDGVFVHETGHSIAIPWDAYTAAIEADSAYITNYSQTNVYEDFSEHFVAYVAYKTQPEHIDPDVLRQMEEGLANRFAIFESMNLPLDILETSTYGEDIVGTAVADDLTSSWGRDTISAGDGNDTVHAGFGNDVVYGGAGNDVLRGEGGNDLVYGGDGNDIVRGDRGNDTLFGENGDDEIRGDDGRDLVNGGAGNDTIWGGNGNDTVNGDAGADSIDGGAGNDLLRGGNQDDTIHGGVGDDVIGGGFDNDLLYGDAGRDQIWGGYGRDTIEGGDDDDAIYGNQDDDQIWGESGKDTIYGGTGNDVIIGGDGNDLIDGEEGDDDIWGSDGNDSIYGGTGNDVLVDGNGNDLLDGGEGDDELWGGAGNDDLSGGAGSDTLYGGDDDDRISGGEGNDLAYGGQGSDVFAHTAQAGGNLRIGDFTAGEDRIDLTAFEITYEDLVSMMTDDGTNIDLGDDRSIFLENVDEEDLNEDMFIF